MPLELARKMTFPAETTFSKNLYETRVWYYSFELITNFQITDLEMSDKNEFEKTIVEDLVVTKYKMAGEIVNRKNFNLVTQINKCFF